MQRQHQNEVAELRRRSAKVIERWYELGVLGVGECWAEWESRVEGVERQVRRREHEKEKDFKEGQTYEA